MTNFHSRDNTINNDAGNMHLTKIHELYHYISSTILTEMLKFTHNTSLLSFDVPSNLTLRYLL